MRIYIFFVIGSFLMFSSCAGTNKQLRKNKKPVTENIIPEREEKKIAETPVVIKEVEEKLIPNGNILPDPHRYFVIIGSFRNPDNAVKYQEHILKEGFTSDILKNEAGLLRVSVMATDEIETAREDIRRIRRIFPEYYDTWLLIQKR